MENKILHGDSLDLLKDMEDNTVDSIVTDPPYGYDFMGKDWDKAVPSVELWEECLMVLKPGGFAFIMSAPRADVQGEMIKRLEKAGFRVDFTPVYWTYATGFPKAHNIGKAIDKKLGVKGEVVGKKECGYQVSISKTRKEQGYRPNETNATKEVDITLPGSDEAKKLNGSFAGYQPKPAVEVIIVVMKPLSEKNYMEQALKNGKGITWLDDLRIPFEMGDTPVGGYGRMDIGIGKPGEKQEYRKTTKRKPRPEDSTWAQSGFKSEENDTASPSPFGRFAANLIVQNGILNTEDDDFSRYYDIDTWWEDRIQDLPLNVQTTYPFMIVAKASKSEKNKGLDGLEEKFKAGADFRPNHKEKALEGDGGNPYGRWDKVKNFHPTVKPISLMSYLVTMGSREGDLVLDPFVGSGTTCIAAKLLKRKYLGMEMDDGYVVIAQERIKAHKSEETEHDFF